MLGHETDKKKTVFSETSIFCVKRMLFFEANESKYSKYKKNNHLLLCEDCWLNGCTYTYTQSVYNVKQPDEKKLKTKGQTGSEWMWVEMHCQ